MPLAARWDKDGTLAAELKPILEPLVARLTNNSVSEQERSDLVKNLIGVRRLDPTILPAIGNILSSRPFRQLSRAARWKRSARFLISKRAIFLVEHFTTIPFLLRELPWHKSRGVPNGARRS